MEASKVPPGGDENRAPGILALAWVECSVSIFLVVTRMYTRRVITRHIGLDDLFIVLTMVRPFAQDVIQQRADSTAPPNNLLDNLDGLREPWWLQACLLLVHHSAEHPH